MAKQIDRYVVALLLSLTLPNLTVRANVGIQIEMHFGLRKGWLKFLSCKYFKTSKAVTEGGGWVTGFFFG